MMHTITPKPMQQPTVRRMILPSTPSRPPHSQRLEASPKRICAGDFTLCGFQNPVCIDQRPSFLSAIRMIRSTVPSMPNMLLSTEKSWQSLPPQTLPV